MRALSLRHAFKNDYALMLSAIISVVPGAVGIMGLALGWLPRLRGGDRVTMTAADAPFTYTIAVGFAAIGIIVFARRWYTLKSLFASGVEVPGRITSIWRTKDRGRVEFAFRYQDAEYNSGTAIHKSAQTDALSMNDKVALLIDPTRPKTAIIVSLYVDHS